MEVVAASPGPGGVPPFHDHDVREWSRIDSLTGVLERARLETDHWTANTSKYGKVVDSRARSNADGALQQQARRQLEVFHSQIPGGHLQVIKTQTVSSSRWTNKSTDLPQLKDFENLQLALNPLDLSSQKSKANVGRSVGRRPPSRPRAKDETLRTAQQNLYRVSRLCHQIHDDAVKQAIRPESNGHRTLTRTKSTSSEDLHLEEKSCKSTEDLEDLEQLQSWRRTSKLRRSLQYPKETTKQIVSKPTDLPENSGSVRKIREELEKGRRLSTALRGNNVDLEALDQILQSISSSSSNQSDIPDDQDAKKQKRNSFVTVEKLQEVRGRLRRTSSPTDEIYRTDKDEEPDDGIVTDNSELPVSEKSRVRSYVYGMESVSKKPIVGTGSLESRSKLINGGTNLRSEDWYNRRKSYGFEQVHPQVDAPNPISLRSKGRVESSTDSGICRSSEIGDDPSSFTSVKRISSIFDQGFNKSLKSTTITIPIVSKPNSNFVDLGWDDIPEKDIKRHSIAVDESKYVTNPTENKFRRTSLAINPSLDDGAQNRRSKKVEFCKTEVHFAAESGKVNIVETDEKPPPTNNFRRRRRNSGPALCGDDFERNGLPVLHFGDTSYEKVLLGVADDDNFAEQPAGEDSSIYTVTVNTNSSLADVPEDEKKDAVENVKGILKNKPVKPTPYLLGEDAVVNSNSDSDSGKWGVRLRPVAKVEPPFWKSTVTLHNTVYGQNEKEEQPEFQKLLRNLRPTSGNKPDLIDNQRNSENFSSVKFVTSADNRRAWSVADRVKLTEDSQWAENKIYSTKVNFGDGGAAVVENKQENPLKDDFNENAKHQLGSEFPKTYKIKLKSDVNYSPPAPRKIAPLAARRPSDLRGVASEKLSSPSLVGRSSKLDTYDYTRRSEFANVTDTKLHEKHSTTDIVLRQPKKSEMTYFGVRVSPHTTKQSVIAKETKLSDKPDLLQHMKTDTPNQRARKKSPDKSPIYENVPREFDANILEELTKAADQILQAVNGFTDDEEQPVKEPLATITESKSWSHDKKPKSVPKHVVKAKLKHTSSTSSVESLARKPAPIKKKTPVAESTARATTKARRLQRASSREALLQSHGSSSEDLGAGVEAPQRKPRQIKKTKSAQLSVNNGIEFNKRVTPPNPPRRRKVEERSQAGVNEIRHKTAVSTIRSATDKSSRDRSRNRSDQAKTKVAPKKDSVRGVAKTDPKKISSARDVSNHRISTANIKKCHRADETIRHS